MKMTSANRSAPFQAGSGHRHFAAGELFKMLAMSILCGLAVSIAAAGITLLLTRTAEAQPVQIAPSASPGDKRIADDGDDHEEIPPAPGILLLGEGCEAVVVNAIERDWQVRINASSVDVRVMQTFQLPADPPEAAFFQLQLVRGAHMKRIAAQTAAREWTGDLISMDEYERLSPAAYLQRSRHRLLATQTGHGTVMTSPFLGLKANELLTIEYTYAMTLEAQSGATGLALQLDAGEERLPRADDRVHGDIAAHAIRGAVWVEWTGRHPSRVIGLPVDADIEQSASQIEGFSWTTGALEPGARLQLSWSI